MCRVSDLQRPCWECELHAYVLYEIHDLQEKDLPLLQLSGRVVDLQMEYYQNIQTTLAEVVEAHLAAAVLGERMIDNELPNPGNQVLHFGAWCVISDL